MIRDIFLHGAAGRAHGRHFRLDVASPAEAVRALIMLRPPLREAFRAGQWRVIIGRPHLANAIDPQWLAIRLGDQPLHIVPATGAAGGDGVGKVVAGVVLIGATILTAGLAAPAGLAAFGTFAGASAALGASAFAGVTYGSIALLGVSMLAAGVVGLLSPAPGVQQQATDMAAPQDRPSFLFNGVTNNTQQGGPVPLVFGTHLVGSVVVSAGLNSEDIAP
jgi:predicted phage tail protein